MRKIISFAVAAMLLGALLASAVSADILWSDNFDNGVFNEYDWQTNGTAFYIENGGPTNSPHLEGWAEAVVQQTSYGENAPAPRVYGPSFAVKCDTWFYDDGGNGAEEHWVALWWADHFEDNIGLDVDRIVYMVRCTYETRKVEIIAHGENGGSDYFDGDHILSEWQIPDSVELEMDPASPTVFNLGMRVNGTQIDGFFNGQKVVSATAPVIHQFKCPLLFWNGGCWTGFDNWVVSTPDYNLFNETAAPVVNPVDPGANNGGGNGGSTEPETYIVTDTDAEGNVVTSIETRERANTGSGSGSGGAVTGDVAVTVAVVMILSLGAAVVVKKIASR